MIKDNQERKEEERDEVDKGVLVHRMKIFFDSFSSPNTLNS